MTYHYITQMISRVQLIGIVTSLLTLSFLSHTYLNTSPSSIYPSFELWKDQFGKSYPKHQQMYRRVNYQRTLQLIAEHNNRADSTFSMGTNQFSDLTDEEFAERYLDSGLTRSKRVVGSEEQSQVMVDVDWVAKGAVSPVKDQGSCLASYAFSAIGAVESVSAIYYKNPTEFSVQQILDCSSGFNNQGCVSGNVERTFDYIKQRGINNQSAYPYKGVVQSCTSMYGKFKVSGYVNVTGCTNLANALIKQPVSVLAAGSNWRTYTYGVFSNCTEQVNIAVLLVGATDSYWRVKNSWGISWGENGYIRLDKTKNCGICNTASYPTK